GFPSCVRNAKFTGSAQLRFWLEKSKLNWRLSIVRAEHQWFRSHEILCRNGRGLYPGGYSCSSMYAAPAWSGAGGTWMFLSLSRGQGAPPSGQLCVSHMTRPNHGAIESWNVHTDPL